MVKAFGFVGYALAAFFALTGAPDLLAKEIVLSGTVRGFNGNPINMIEVTAYRGDAELDHGFTSEAGVYQLKVPEGGPVTLRFDTHYSLTNANEWHPSVVTNIDGGKDIGLDRVLLRVGEGDSFATAIDALAAYEHAAFWQERSPNKAYASSAATRLGPFKLPTPALQEIQRNLQTYFIEQSQAP